MRMRTSLRVVLRLFNRPSFTNSLRCLGGIKYSHCRSCSTAATGKLMSQLQGKIRSTGPLSVADYMKEALTHPQEGYYIHKDVFGEEGDFTTSPEISQMFGELVGIWFVNEWMKAGSPDKVQLVEMGPGRGTMADDILRAISKFPDFKNAVSLHLVEISEKLNEMQEQKLSVDQSSVNRVSAEDQSSPDRKSDDTNLHYKSCVSKYGPSVFWYSNISDVPPGFTMFVAHEFFDALPIHKFQKTERGWREILVDIDPAKENELRFVLAPAETAASRLFLKVDPSDTRKHIEVCPDAGVIVEYLAERISIEGGNALLIDYGHNGDKEDTFRGFKSHSLHEVLDDPGDADLTADVDFSYLKQQAQDLVRTVGPVTQSTFLHNMGIALRLKMLYEKATPEDQEQLLSSYAMLTSPEEMGERFKFLALLHKDTTHDPAGFDPIPEVEQY